MLKYKALQRGDKMTNVVVINENIKFSEKEYYHKDFKILQQNQFY